MPKNRRAADVGSPSTVGVDEGDVSDESFRHANVSLMPEENDNNKMAAALPQMNVKTEMMQPPSYLKVVNRPI